MAAASKQQRLSRSLWANAGSATWSKGQTGALACSMRLAKAAVRRALTSA
jgi:hypothetical protein